MLSARRAIRSGTVRRRPALTRPESSTRLAWFWRQLRGLLLTTLAVLVIGTAVLVGVGRALAPFADEIRPWLQQAMSERIGQTVEIDKLEARWPRLTPQLNLIGVHLDDGQGNRLEIDQARLELSLLNVVNPRANPVRLVLLGLELILEPDEDGRWGAELAGGAATSGDAARDQLPFGDLLIRDARVTVRPRQWPELVLQLDEGGIERHGSQTQFHGIFSRMEMPEEQIDLRLLIDHHNGRWESARGWLGADGLDLESFLFPPFRSGADEERSRLDLELWLEWSGAGDRLRLDLDYALTSGAEAAPLSGQALLMRSRRAIQIDLPELLHGPSRIGAGLAIARNGDHWAVAADHLDLGALHAALEPWMSGLAHWPGNAGGRVEDLLLGLDRSLSVHAASGRIERLSLALADPLPSVSGLDLALGLAGDRLVLAPGGRPAIRWPHLIRADATLDVLSGAVLVSPDGLELRGLQIEHPVAAARADGWIYLQRPRPFLDFVIEVDRVGPADPRPYLTYRTIPETAMEWLDQSLTWVEHASGFVNFHMRAGTLARDLRPGSYQAVVDFDGVVLDYWPDWPKAETLSGRAEFLGKRLAGRVDRGRLGAIELTAPELEIADLTAPELSMSLHAADLDSGALAATLGAIPIVGWQAMVEPMRWSGPVDVTSQLVLPFASMEDWWLEGQLDLHQAELHLPLANLTLEALSGRLEFDRSALKSTTIQARLTEQLLELDVEADFTEPASLALAGRVNPADLLPRTGMVGLLAARMTGDSHWSYRLAGSEDGLVMQIESDLDGLGLDWPAPLDKAPGQVWPTSIELHLREELGHRLGFVLGDRLSGELAGLPDDWSLSLGLGDRAPPSPLPAGISISGHIERFAGPEWIALFETLSGDDPAMELPGPVRLRLEVDALELPAVTANNASLALDRRDETWLAEVDSRELAGTVTVPLAPEAGRAVVGDFSRLYLNRVESETLPEDLEGPVADDQFSRFSPAGLPPMSLVIEDLRWGKLSLGRLRMEAHPGEHGLEVELLDLSGDDLRVQGRGRWVDADEAPLSKFHGRLATPSLSALLQVLGYEAGIEAARAQVDLDVQWPGAPSDFALRRLLGTMDLSMSDGQIPEARPGAGRLLGLVSFNAIPRRLMLDFRDVFGPGMRFDDIEGRFDLAGGLASTDGLVMRSTAAVITIRGETDMAARMYDQEVLVEPGLGATLPVIGVLAGGPVGAAAGLVLRQLLERPLRGVAEVRYRVTGPWDAPDIELYAARLPEPADQLETDEAEPLPPEND
ncbi:MAG: TIGR02099 family protein [Wenzhouxiangella sp.]|nr:MAG: TIGR02099 family protein [Wenzhouxiangella sp.]